MPVFLLILLALILIALLPLSRKGHPAARMAVIILSVLVAFGAVHRLFFTPSQSEKRIQSYVDYNGLSGAYAGNYIAQQYPGEDVAVIVQSINPMKFEMGMVDKAILRGLKQEIEQTGASIQTVTTQQKALTAESVGNMLDDLNPDLVIEDLPEEAKDLKVVVSLVGNPGQGLINAVAGKEASPALFVFQDTYPPRLAGAIRSGQIEGMVCLRVGVDPDMTFSRKAPMEEQFNRRFHWVTADNTEILSGL